MSINPLNLFTGSVQVTLSGLPSGIVSSPVSPFSIAAGSSVPVLFSAAANASTGNSTIIAQGASGSLSHPANLELTIQAGVVANLPRTSYARTDSVPAMDDPSGEPHHRHQDLPRPEESCSSISSTRMAQVSIPGASSADLSPALTPDGSQLVAADFGSQSIYLFNPDTRSGTTVPVGGVAGFQNSGPARVAATSAQSIFVGLSAESGSSGACASCLGQLNLTTNPPAIQPVSQPEVSSITGAPLVQSNGNGDQDFVAFASAPGGPLALWNSSSPNQFSTFTANDSATDLGAAADGTMFALQTSGTTEIRTADLSLAAVPAAAELTQIPGRNQVPGVTLHPSGALLYQPFLTGPAGNAGVKGGIDILDAHSGALRLRILLPQQFMTAADALHGSFLTTDENGQRLFALTSQDGTAQNAGITIVTLANVPLGIGTLTPASAPASGGTTLTIRGSGFATGATATIGGKSATVTFKDIDTLTVVTPSLSAGAQHLTITNPDGESTSLDAAFTAN